MRREENVKRSRSQEKRRPKIRMPRERERERERRQRKAAETTSASRGSDNIRKSLSGKKSVSSLWLQSCRQEGLSRFRNVRSKPGQEKVAASGREQEMSRTKASKRSRSQRLCQPSGQALFL